MSRLVGTIRGLLGSMAFRAAVTAALLVAVFTRIDWATITERVQNGNLLMGVIAVLFIDAALLVGAWRWGRLLQVANVSIPTRDTVRIYVVTSFANAFLPTSIGGDVARPWMVSRRGPMLTRAIATVLIERLVALVALLALAWVGFVLEPTSVSTGARSALLVASLGLAIAVAVIGLRPRLVAGLVRTITPARFSASLNELSGVARNLRRSRANVAAVLLMSVAFQALVTMQLVFLGRMIGVNLSFALAAVALALVTLAMLLPVSIGGFGVREGSYVVILAGGGISHTDAVLISLLSVVALFFATLPGAVGAVRTGMKPVLDQAPVA